MADEKQAEKRREAGEEGRGGRRQGRGASAPAVPNLSGIEPITASPVTPKKGKKRVKKNIANGIVHIQSTFNNTMITITDVDRERHLLVVSAGARGFKGSRKSTPFAAQVAAGDAAAKAMEHGLKSVVGAW